MKRWLLFGLNLLFCAIVASYSLPTQTDVAAISDGESPVFPQLSPEEARRLLIQGTIIFPENTPEGVPDAAGTTPDFLNLSGMVAFSSNRQTTNHNLYSAPADNGASTTLLVNSTGEDFTPVWSPDGTEIVFVSNRDGDFEIFRRTAGGQEIQLTFNTADDVHPSWSPNGTKILFASDRSGSYFQIYTMNSNGSNQQPVGAVPNNNALYPRYSPDGTRIAFMRASILEPVCTWNWDIWVMSANGGNQQQVTTQLGADLYPTWSPDGSKIIYAGCPNLLAFDLYTRNPDTGTQSQITNTLLTNEWAAVYAPDNTYLAYASDATSNTDIWVREVNGNTPINWSNHPGEDLAPHWHQDNQINLSGRVLDATEHPIHNVTITTNNGLSTTTNFDGHFSLGTPPGTYTLTATKTGYSFIPTSHTVIVPPGSNSLSFTAFPNCNSAGFQQQPIMLLHGWGGPDNLYQDESGFVQMMPELEATGYVLGCNLFYVTGIGAQNTRQENIEAIQTKLHLAYDTFMIHNPNWNGHFDLIGHSYGGLHSRFYLESDTYRIDQTYGTVGIHVDNLFTLGSPHGGAIFPDELYPGAIIIGGKYVLNPRNGAEFLSALQLYSGMMELYNDNHQQPPTTCYRLIGGDFLQQTNMPNPLRWVYTHFYEFYPGDIGVSQRSAMELAMNPNWDMEYPHALFAPNTDMHGYLAQLDELRSYVYTPQPGQTTYAQLIHPFLGKDINHCVAMGVYQDSTMAPPFPVMGTSPVQPIQVFNQIASNAQTMSGQLPINWAGHSTFTISWSGQGQAELILRASNGQLITPSIATSDPNLDYGTIFWGNTGFATYIITNTLTGTWSYTATVSTIPITSTLAVEMTVIPDNSMNLVASTPSWQSVNEPVIITATLTSQSQPVIAANVEGTITRPTGVQDTLMLLDNGIAPDLIANDGVYSGIYLNNTFGGYYPLIVKATGSYQGQNFVRTAQTVFAVGSNQASLNGQYTDYPLDADGNGRYEALIVDIGVQVNDAGVYTVVATLQASNGTIIALANKTVNAAVGNLMIPLLFTGEAIYAGGLNGPYTVTEVVLSDEMALLELDTANNAWQTAPYQYQQFGPLMALYLPSMLKP